MKNKSKKWERIENKNVLSIFFIINNKKMQASIWVFNRHIHLSKENAEA